MGLKYLWDTNIVIYYLQQHFSVPIEKYLEELLREQLPCISVITEIELLSWKTDSENDWNVLAKFINDATVIELDKQIKNKSADIRKQYNIKLPDAIIGATALVHNLTLITRNIKDFENIQGLTTINPWSK